MDFFFDLFDSDTKKKPKAESKSKTSINTGSGELPSVKGIRGHQIQNVQQCDLRGNERINQEGIHKDLHRLYMWDNATKEGAAKESCETHIKVIKRRHFLEQCIRGW